jgi:hypothetical protein
MTDQGEHADGAFKRDLTFVVGLGALLHPNQLCVQGPPSLAALPICTFASASAFGLLGAFLALLLSFVVWWPW